MKIVICQCYVTIKGNENMQEKKIQLTENESNILNYIADNEILWFLQKDFNKSGICTFDELKNSLSRLTKTRHLERLERSLYCVRNFKNTYLIANLLSENSVIAYWSALNLHGLTEQIPNIVYSQSLRRKNDKTIFKVRYKFVMVKPEKMFGAMQMGYGNEIFRITDVEKTLLDCFNLPQYSGGYAELIRAFYSAKISSTRLLEYGLKMNNLSVLKRIGFLSELFQMNGFMRFQQKVLKRVNKKYTLIDPFGEDIGEFIPKWRLRLNITRENLLGIIQKVY
jgi:predicted transcriptional regulator of viral defense system